MGAPMTSALAFPPPVAYAANAGNATRTTQLSNLDTADNIEELASIIKTEAGGCNRAEQIAVGRTVLNRMRRNGTNLVGDVRGYRDEKDPDDLSLEIARGILGGNIVDNSGGATHFYSPQIMPREGDSTAGYDVGGGRRAFFAELQAFLCSHIPACCCSWCAPGEVPFLHGAREWHNQINDSRIVLEWP